jgi:hypothetical protein
MMVLIIGNSKIGDLRQIIATGELRMTCMCE